MRGKTRDERIRKRENELMRERELAALEEEQLQRMRDRMWEREKERRDWEWNVALRRERVCCISSLIYIIISLAY